MFTQKRNLYWTLQLTGWYLFFGFNELILNTDNTKEGSFVFLLFNPPFGIVFTHIYRNQLKQYLEKTNAVNLPWKFIVQAWILLTVGFAALNLGIASYVLLQRNESLPAGDYIVLAWISLLLSTPWFLIYHIYKFAQIAIQQGIQKSKVESLLHIAELENLKNQLNPHFLFNALNSIKALTITDPHRARDAITKLSDLLRVSLNYGRSDQVSVEQELMLVDDYLVIEKMRFEKRLNYVYEIDDLTKPAMIPPMIIQTLVENGIKHGIAQRRTGGHIWIKTAIENNKLFIKVTNSGSLKIKNTGIGLKILQKRVASSEGASFSISEDYQAETVSVIIRMNMDRK